MRFKAVAKASSVIIIPRFLSYYLIIIHNSFYLGSTLFDIQSSLCVLTDTITFWLIPNSIKISVPVHVSRNSNRPWNSLASVPTNSNLLFVHFSEIFSAELYEFWRLSKRTFCVTLLEQLHRNNIDANIEPDKLIHNFHRQRLCNSNEMIRQIVRIQTIYLNIIFTYITS